MARILLLTQDPTIRGGGTRVASVAKLLLGELGHEYTEAYVANLSQPRVTVRGRGGPLHWFGDATDARPLLAVLPELQVPPILSGMLAMRRLRHRNTWDHVLVVGASVYHGAVGLGLGLPTSVWAGTTLGDERRSQWASYDPARRLVHRAAMPFLERWERRVLRTADRVAANSPYGRDILEQVAGRRVDVVYPCVPLPPYDSPARRAELLGRGRLSCIFVGRVSDRRKRFSDVLKVVADLAAHGSQDRVELAVTASTKELAAFTVPAGVQLRCLGYPDDAALAEAVSQAHWLLMGSLQEGFGFVAAEALACGTPVASTRSGGPEAMINASGGGLLADIADMARQVAAASADGWAAMSVNAREFAAKTLTAAAVLPGFRALLDVD